MPAGLEFRWRRNGLMRVRPKSAPASGCFTSAPALIELTGGIDFFISAYRPGPLVSGYHAGEWFAWNWWRLRGTTLCGTGLVARPQHGRDWRGVCLAKPDHFLRWREDVALLERSVRPDAKPFRYLGAPACVLPSAQFRGAG